MAIIYYTNHLRTSIYATIDKLVIAKAARLVIFVSLPTKVIMIMMIINGINGINGTNGTNGINGINGTNENPAAVGTTAGAS